MKGILGLIVIAQTQDDPYCISPLELAQLDKELKEKEQACTEEHLQAA